MRSGSEDGDSLATFSLFCVYDVITFSYVVQRIDRFDCHKLVIKARNRFFAGHYNINPVKRLVNLTYACHKTDIQPKYVGKIRRHPQANFYQRVWGPRIAFKHCTSNAAVFCNFQVVFNMYVYKTCKI